MHTPMTRAFNAIAACGALFIAGMSMPVAAVAGPSAGGPALTSATASGTQLWSKRYPGGNDPTATVADVAVSPAGDKVFVTGESSFGYMTLAYRTSTGARLWAKRYHGPTTWVDYATAVAVSPSGKTVFVTGSSVGTTPGDYATIAYNASTGAQLWIKRYSGPGNSLDAAYDIKVSPNGKIVFVTGGQGGILTDTDYVTIAYNAATGAQLWQKRYDGPARLDDSGISLVVGPKGTLVFVTGTSWSTRNAYDIVTIAYRASTGARAWLQRYNGPGNGDDTGLSAAINPTGTTMFVAGKSMGATSGDDYVTIAYNTGTGAQRWVKRYNGPANGIDQAHAVAVSPSGTTVYVTGHSDAASTGADYATIAYNAATGAERWLRRHNGSGNGDDVAVALAVSPGGKSVYVTGTSLGRVTDFDYATISYNATTGARRWIRWYTGPRAGANGGTAVVVGPKDGRVFVSGRSQGVGAGCDWVTIAYSG